MKVSSLLLLLPFAGSLHAYTYTISLNFVGGNGPGNGQVRTVTGLAGLPQASADALAAAAGVEAPNSFVGNWNNLTGATNSAAGMLDHTGVATGVGAAWTSNNTWSIPDANIGANLSGGQNPQMMQGYLDTTGTSTTQVDLSGLSTLWGTAAVNGTQAEIGAVVYFDGDNGEAWRKGRYDAYTSPALGTVIDTFSGEDSEGVDFNNGPTGGTNENPDGIFQLPVGGAPGNATFGTTGLGGPNNEEGNFGILFGTPGSDGFTITATPTNTRAPINGIQIWVTIPEPSRALLLASGIGLLALRRRR